MSYKTTDGLMRHLRDNGIDIRGSNQKRQLRNTGYFHGYKGYRFFNNSQKKLPFTNYAEIYATIEYDSALKNLLYGKIMFIETAVKNIALEGILINAQSESIQDMYEKVVCGYKNSPETWTAEQKKKAQKNKLILQNSIQTSLVKAYSKNNPKITHFYNNVGNSDVPIWALFEIMTMGDLGYLLSCLTFSVREDISKRIGINIVCDSERQLLYKYIYILKDLRNEIAHNGIVFDTRFKKMDPSPAMRQCLITEIGLPYMNFKSIGDYIILVCYYLKILKVPKKTIKSFIREFEIITEDYKKSVNSEVSKIVIHPDLSCRMNTLKNYI